MPKIETITLRCLNPEAMRRFYIDILGMDQREDGAVSYGPAQAGIIFEKAEYPYRHSAGDVYWKIALAVPNIELAYEQLTTQGLAVGVPHQFRDIGYLAHFQDPEGFTIELIEHWFQGNRPSINHDPSRLGGGASLNLLTLRTHEINPIRDACLTWGMRPLSVQSVESHGFTLHFFAFTEDTPPSADLTAVKNREWLYQRPYTVLEIQEVHGSAPMTGIPVKTAGYSATRVTGVDVMIDCEALRITGQRA
ncbi:glyoxalase/bleomycin resistance protein/dioxygenase [Roseibium sp. TrichSKD4]|uniref:VOC family protein n=1 Tax=Roseibium sp. TrichSKD4 TaxID=744980 RepID=UPI0001E5759E|nr:VOC family protein [Roseibium sp. TrichSKD4]EFO30905.1 glyoxalase/bleomycin resistance protein/dioxygenase [Roseibium sp. TrichSKD4]